MHAVWDSTISSALCRTGCPAWAMVLHTVKMGLPVVLHLIKIVPHRHTQKPIYLPGDSRLYQVDKDWQSTLTIRTHNLSSTNTTLIVKPPPILLPLWLGWLFQPTFVGELLVNGHILHHLVLNAWQCLLGSCAWLLAWFWMHRDGWDGLLLCELLWTRGK